MVVGTRWQRRKRRFRILVNVPSAVQAQRSVSSGWRQKIRSLRSSSGRFPCSATYAARAKLSLFSAVISFARSEDRQPHLQPRTQRISRNRCTPEFIIPILFGIGMVNSSRKHLSAFSCRLTDKPFARRRKPVYFITRSSESARAETPEFRGTIRGKSGSCQTARSLPRLPRTSPTRAQSGNRKTARFAAAY